MREIGVGTVFDLRSKPEIEKAGLVAEEEEGVEKVEGDVGGAPTDALKEEAKEKGTRWLRWMEEEGVKREWVPVFEESDYSPARLAERYMKYMSEGVDVSSLFFLFSLVCLSVVIVLSRQGSSRCP